MNKNYELKKEQQYQSSHLRGRIAETIKQFRDAAEEAKHLQGKSLAIIPVTGGKVHKYFSNKSRRDYSS